LLCNYQETKIISILPLFNHPKTLQLIQEMQVPYFQEKIIGSLANGG
jgi:hypothetical protein